MLIIVLKMETFFKEFKVSKGNYNFYHYFTPESCIPIPSKRKQNHLGFLIPQETREMTIGDLEKAADSGRWDVGLV